MLHGFFARNSGVRLFKPIQPDLLILLQEVTQVGLFDRLELFRREVIHTRRVLRLQPAPMSRKFLIHSHGFDPNTSQGFSVILRLEREGFFGFRIGVCDVFWDRCAVIVNSAATVQTGMTGHVFEGPHCNTSA
ncbi:hypothetical protein SAMN04488077_10772 [Roseovarius tolerans]|uniref:Uncharacterized protein n=1 Tax=Roseovarius tolerans TaxID=74031 RepID=A0A1H8AKG8_9RHOB|nr:hypothetical protein SAMN04488077_10772 [Roseovarius tolerans]